MRTLKLLALTLISSILFTSCVVVNNNDDDFIPLEEVVSGYDLWYIDYHRTTGTGDVPFLSRAFTVSFLNGRMYANNNIVDIGYTGNGLGIMVGNYSTFDGYLETRHDIDGYFDFDVVVISNNEIRIDDLNQNVSYYLIGYQTNTFDYVRLFYDNIEYFLQEYVAWEKTNTIQVNNNAFDEENYLQFTPENTTTFYSSHDPNGTNIDNIYWDYVGSYEVFNIIGENNLKGLTLNYDGGDNEYFELTVLNDNEIRLFHTTSGTYYTFRGRGFLQYLKNENGKENTKDIVRNNGRKRTKIIRKSKEKYLK